MASMLLAGVDRPEFWTKNVHPRDFSFRRAEVHGIVLVNEAASMRPVSEKELTTVAGD